MKHSPSAHARWRGLVGARPAPRSGAPVGGRRRGTAAVEFALVVPIMLSVIMGTIEFGRAFMALDMLNNIARQGARVGAVANRANTDINDAVDNALKNSTLPSRGNGTTLTIKVNNNSVDASTAQSDDHISVTVSVQVSSITWLPASWFLSQGTVLSSSVVMRRE